MAAAARQNAGVHMFSRHNLAAVRANPVLHLTALAERAPAAAPHVLHIRTYKVAQGILAKNTKVLNAVQRQLRARSDYHRKLANFDICAQWNRPVAGASDDMIELEQAARAMQIRGRRSPRSSPRASPTRGLKRLSQAPRKILPTPPREPAPPVQRRKLPGRPLSCPSSPRQEVAAEVTRPRLSLHDLPLFHDEFDEDEPEVADLFGSITPAGDRPRPAISCNLFAREVLTVTASPAAAAAAHATAPSPSLAAPQPMLGSSPHSAFAAITRAVGVDRTADGASVAAFPAMPRPVVPAPAAGRFAEEAPVRFVPRTQLLRTCKVDAHFQPI